MLYVRSRPFAVTGLTGTVLAVGGEGQTGSVSGGSRRIWSQRFLVAATLNVAFAALRYRSCAIERERQNGVDGCRSSREHDEAVEAEGDAGAGGEAVVHGRRESRSAGQVIRWPN